MKNLKRLTLAVSATLGQGEFLNYEKSKLQYRGDTIIDAILSAIANIYKYQVPAYNTALETHDQAKAEKIKEVFLDLRFKEFNQHPEAASQNLFAQLIQEYEIERQEWATMRDVIAVGLNNVSDAGALQQKANLRVSRQEQLNGGPKYVKESRKFSLLAANAQLGNSLQSPLQKLEDTQKQLSDLLAGEERTVKSLSPNVNPISSAEISHAGKLKTRGAVVTSGLQAIYESSEFNEAYAAAAVSYQNSRAEPAYAASAWDAKKPLVWLMHSEQQMWAYSREFEALKYRLDAATEIPQILQNATKVAQISAIQDRLTEDNLNALNELIGSVDLKAFFKSNRLPDVEIRWTPAPLPEHKRVLDESKMVEVVKLLENVNTCLTASGKARVQFAHSTSFSSNVPRDEDDKPLTTQQALVFWQWHNHGPVDKAVVQLYDSLQRAQKAAAEEGLFGDPDAGPGKAGSEANR